MSEKKITCGKCGDTFDPKDFNFDYGCCNMCKQNEEDELNGKYDELGELEGR